MKVQTRSLIGVDQSKIWIAQEIYQIIQQFQDKIQ